MYAINTFNKQLSSNNAAAVILFILQINCVPEKKNFFLVQ